MFIKHSGLTAVLLVGGMLAASGAQANSIVSRDFADNDCVGYFGGGQGQGGFDACTIWVNNNGETIEISPVIAQYDGGTLSVSNTNGTEFPTIDGTEFRFSNPGDAVNKTGDWDYVPNDLEDPGVRYWAAKSGNGFRLFWDVDSTATATGGVCDVADVYTLACLNEALTVSSGSWTTPGNKDLSHITFYDSQPPSAVVPVPAAVWLFGSGLLGLVGVARRRKA